MAYDDAELLAAYQAAQQTPQFSDEALQSAWAAAQTPAPRAERPSVMGAIKNAAIGPDVMNALRSVSQGVTLGFGDEAVAGARSLMGADYGRELANERAAYKAYSEENPVTSFAGEMAGGSLIPVGRAKEIARAGGAIRRAGEAAKLGAVLSAGYGAGTGEGAGDRAGRAAIGAAIGGAATGGASLLTSGGVNIAEKLGRTDTVQDAVAAIRRALADEAGAVTPGMAKKAAERALPKLTDAERALLNEVSARNIPAKQIKTAVTNLREAMAEGQKDFNIMDAGNRSGLLQMGRFYRALPGTSDYVDDALSNRYPGQVERMAAALKNTESDESQRALKEGISSYVEKLKANRATGAKQLYDEAYAKTPLLVDDKKLEEVLSSKLIQNEIKAAKENFPQRYGMLDDRDYRLLDRVKQGLDDKVRNRDTGVNLTDVKSLKNDLIGVLDKYNPEYGAARAEYQALSEPINRIAGKGRYGSQAKQSGLASDILKVDDVADPNKIGAALLKKTPEQLKEIKALGPDIEQQTKEAFYGHLKAQLDTAGETEAGYGKFLKQFRGGTAKTPTAFQQKAKTILGDEEYTTLMKQVGYELRRAKTNAKTYVGSPTFQNQQAKAGLGKWISKALAAVKSPISGTAENADSIINAAMVGKNDLVARDIARALVNQKRGVDSFSKIADYVEEVTKRQRIAKALASKVSAGEAEIAGIGLSRGE